MLKITSKSSKALPFVAAAILFASLFVEAGFDIEVDLEIALPFLMAIGVSGAGLKAVERAAKAKAMTPEFIDKVIAEVSSKIIKQKIPESAEN